MLLRFDPFREFDRLWEAVNTGAGAATHRTIPMNAVRRGDQLLVSFDLPGVAADAIDLTVEKNVLQVRAERTWRRQEDDEVVVAERPQGAFTRQLFLGEGLDPDRIEASFHDGVLEVTIPVAEQAKPRKVSVASAGHTEAIEASSHEAA